MTRHRPSDEAVRRELRDERERVEGDGAPAVEPEEAAPGEEAASDGTAPAGAEAEEHEAPEGPPEDPETAEGEREEGEPEPEAAEPEEPEDPLAAARRERDEYLDLARRAQADFENYRKRAAKEQAAAGTRAKVGLIRELLPAIDNLERALASAGEAGGGGEAAEGGEAPRGFAEGLRLVHSELVGALARSGVEALEPAGDPFDPNLHEALSTRSEDGAEPGVVLDVVEKGYRMGDAVIRPARVVVSA